MSCGPIDINKLELNQELHKVLRFLIEDQAFSTEFLVTTILEYAEKNMKNEIKHAP